MEQEKETTGVAARIVTVDLVVALLIGALGALVVYESARLGSSWGSDGPEAGYFPFYIGLFICVCSGVIAVQSALRLRTDRRTFVEYGQLKQVLTILVPTFGYVLGVQLIGIYVSAAVFILLFMKFMGKYSWLRSVIVGGSVSVCAFVMFEIWFKTPLPKGPVENLLGY